MLTHRGPDKSPLLIVINFLGIMTYRQYSSHVTAVLIVFLIIALSNQTVTTIKNSDI